MRSRTGGLLRDVLEGLRSRPGRTALAVVAVAVGAATLSLLVAALTSLEATSRRLVEELGANAVVILPDPSSGDVPTARLEVRHAALVAANFPELMVSTVARTEARTLGSSRALQVVSTDPHLARVRDWEVRDGRFLDSRDLAAGRRHLVLSHGLAAEHGWRTGQVVLLGDVPFVVVGVVYTQGGSLAGQLGNPQPALGEHLAFVPRTVPASWAADRTSESVTVDALYLRTPEGTRPEAFVASLQHLLSAPGDSPGGLSWVTPETLVERIDRLQIAIGWTAAMISLLCLVLGGTTLMSLMLTNVRERVPEIGLRKTLGATRADVARLFVAESVALTVVGGLAGAAAAHAVAVLLDPLLPIGLATGWLSWSVPVATCVVCGLLFSWGPASRAAAISPATALRSE